MRTHPHTGATYRIVPLSGGTFGVEVVIPDTSPIKVSSFPTEADAEAWIERDKVRINTESVAGRWFKRPPRPMR